MVVEHTFVTTLPPTQALTLASEFLGKSNFKPVIQTAFAMGNTEWTGLEMQRGKEYVRGAQSILELPQQISLDWDRGRITVAGSIGDRYSKKKRTELLLAIVNGLENVLMRGQTIDASSVDWLRLEATLKRNRFLWIAKRVGIVLLSISIFGLIGYLSARWR